MTVLVCTDLDRTLIYSRRAAGEADPVSLRCVEHYRGLEASFLTTRAAADLTALDEVAVWVPTTTRTQAQYQRVRLPRGPGAGRFAVCANGGTLLVDGVPDPEWTDRVRAVVADAAPADDISAALARGRAELGADVIGPTRDADGLFRYVVVDRDRLAPSWVTDLDAWCRARRWRTSLQGRKLYCLPVALTKAAAAREIARRSGARTLLAAGDSLLDADLLEAADSGFRPAHGELHAQGWHREHVTVTAASGARAGEEIARRLLLAAQGPGSGAHLLPAVQRRPQP